jgi:hypothetical protein
MCSFQRRKWNKFCCYSAVFEAVEWAFVFGLKSAGRGSHWG